MANKGWIKLHRTLIENDIWTKERFTEGQAWVDLLILANGEDNGNYKRGSVYRGKEWLSKRWKWERHTVSRFLDKLEKNGMITQNRTQGGPHNGTVITIVKWGFFQNDVTHYEPHYRPHYEPPKRRKEEREEKLSALPKAADVGIAGDPMKQYEEYMREKSNEL